MTLNQSVVKLFIDVAHAVCSRRRLLQQVAHQKRHIWRLVKNRRLMSMSLTSWKSWKFASIDAQVQWALQDDRRAIWLLVPTGLLSWTLASFSWFLLLTSFILFFIITRYGYDVRDRLFVCLFICLFCPQHNSKTNNNNNNNNIVNCKAHKVGSNAESEAPITPKCSNLV